MIQPIDLRNARPEKLPEKEEVLSSVTKNDSLPKQSPPQALPEKLTSTTLRVQKKDALLEWSTPEYENRERGPNWFLVPGIIALALAVIAILAKNYSFLILIILTFILLLIYMKRPPRMLEVAIQAKGITIGSTFFPFSELISFWIFDQTDDKELSIKTHRNLMPFIKIPLGSTDSNSVRSLLTKYLKEEEHEEFATDQIAKKMGF